MLAQPSRRQLNIFDHQNQQNQPNIYHASSHRSTEGWVSPYSTPLTSTSSGYAYSDSNSDFVQSASSDQSSPFDYHTQHNFNNLRIHVNTPFESSQDPELMRSDQSVAPANWNFMNGQLTPTSARTHYRESSLSSIGSAGPASPYNGSTPHLHVILPSDSETNYEGLPTVDQAPYHTFSKPLTPSHTPSQDPFLVPPFQQGYSAHTYNSNSHIAALLAMQRQQAAGDDESLSAPEYAHSGRPSVASSRDSPATPPVAVESEDSGRKPDFRGLSAIPKLDRTMSDIYNDELYSPNFSYTSAPSTKVDSMTMSHPHSALFSQMLRVANDQHLSAPSRSPLADQSRDQKIAFREGSPLAPISNSYGSPQMRFGSAQQIRERQKAENDDRILQQQLRRTSPSQAAPKTISPRDALLEYHGTGEGSAMPLFPALKSPQYHLHISGAQAPAQVDFEDTASQQSFGSMVTSRRESSSAYSTSPQAPQLSGSSFTFTPPSVPGSVRVPQQYPFVPQQRVQMGNATSLADRSPEFPSTVTLMGPSNSGYGAQSPGLKKPAGSGADGGTYTCTYHGCILRFETPAKLQKHKREGHRQAAPTGGNGAAQASQSGPHKCQRKNPLTGVVCNTIFSRPYDLTRHEDTIHNSRKIKVRCPLCREEKTFSRNDALTRHLKLVHPHEITLPTKNRRSQH